MAADPTYQTKNYQVQGGSLWVIAGELRFEGGTLTPAGGVQPGPNAALIDNSTGVASGTLAAVTAPAALVDSTGGVAATTFAAITAPAANATTSLTADMTAVKNALAQTVVTANADRAAIAALTNAVASLAAQVNTLLTLLKNVGITT